MGTDLETDSALDQDRTRPRAQTAKTEGSSFREPQEEEHPPRQLDGESWLLVRGGVKIAEPTFMSSGGSLKSESRGHRGN